MADTTWPTSLRDLWLRDGFREVVPKNMIRSSMDVGPAKVRRRTTANVRPFFGQMFLTSALVATLDTFFVTTTKSGTLTVELKHPRTGSTGTYRFVKEPQYVPHNRGFMASVQMELLP